MTNFVKIHCMTAEKLAEFLSKCDSCGEGPWWKWFDETRCKKCEAEASDGDVPCENSCECALYDDSPKAVILAWLGSEHNEDCTECRHMVSCESPKQMFHASSGIRCDEFEVAK